MSKTKKRNPPPTRYDDGNRFSVISKFAPAKIGKVKSPLFGNLTGPT